MRILVLGTGQSGTCLLCEVPRGLGIVEFSNWLEDGEFFNCRTLPENYGTKLVTDFKEFSTPKPIRLRMEDHPDLHIIFSIRHPFDICMSKIYRGWKGESPDATAYGSISEVRRFYMIHTLIERMFPERIHDVMLENLIKDPDTEVRGVAKFLDAEVTEKALKFYQHNRNKYHKERHKSSLDPSQVDIFNRWDTIYDGFFSQRKGDIDRIKEELTPIARAFGYEVSI